MRKLVRNEIPRFAKGQIEFYKVSKEEYINLLKQKLIEESEEVNDPSSDLLEELCDVYEVVQAIAQAIGSNMDVISKIAKDKARKKGSFSEGWITDQAEELKALYIDQIKTNVS
jgi:predicted house-cleaning noncanonical NTP pyrophosphatase (MazG superfamily)